MGNSLDRGPSFAQAQPDTGGMAGGVVPVSSGTPTNALNGSPVAPGPQQIAPGAAPGIVPQQGPPQPAPTHEQTVAALHHTSEVTHQLMTLMKDPEIGRKDMRSQIVDASLELVQKGLATVPAIVEQIKDLPSDPKKQLDWVKGHLLANQLAQFAVLQHHGAAFPGTLDYATDRAMHPPALMGKNKKSHGDIMKSLVSHYRGPR